MLAALSHSISICLPLQAVPVLATAAGKVHICNWSDGFAEDTLSGFQAKTGIDPVLDVYDANEVLEDKLPRLDKPRPERGEGAGRRSAPGR